MTRWNWKSKFTPTDLTFKWGEEFDYYDPILKQNTKNVNTKNGNLMEIITKSENGIWITRAAPGVSFMTIVSKLQKSIIEIFNT